MPHVGHDDDDETRAEPDHRARFGGGKQRAPGCPPGRKYRGDRTGSWRRQADREGGDHGAAASSAGTSQVFMRMQAAAGQGLMPPQIKATD